MKKLIPLLLAVLCAMALAACSGKPEETDPNTQPPEPTVIDPTGVEPEVTYPNASFDPEACTQILGTWKTPVTLDGTLMNMPEFEGSVSFDVLFTFQNTGRYTINADKTAVMEAITTYENLLAQYMIDGFYARFTAEKKLEGMSEADIEKAWTEEQEEVARGEVDTFLDAMALTTRFSAIITHGDYYVQAENLFLSNGDGTYEAYTFTVRNGMLYFTGCSDTSKYQNLWLDFPLPLWPEGSSYEDMVPEDLAPTDPTYPTVTVPIITDPPAPTDPTEPEPTAPEGYVTIPTMVGTLWPFPTAPAETTEAPTTKPTDPTEAPTQATKPAAKPTKPTEAATEAPTVKPTKPSAAEPTPTDPLPTEAPTDPTEATTEATTEPETTAPTYVTDPDDGPIDTDVDWAM